MFPVKEEPANTIQPTFSSSLQTTTAPSFFPPPNTCSSNNPLSSHSNTPQPLQFDLFGAPPTKVSSPPAKQQSQQQNTFDFFGPPTPAAPQNPQQKAQDNFAYFDAVFNNFSISDKPVPPVPQTQPVSNGFLSSTPNIIQSVLEPVMHSQPFESSSVKPEPQKEVKKDDGLPDYSALEALYHAEDEPVDFFGFGKSSNNIQSNPSATLSTTTAANGFAKSKTTDFGYQAPLFPSSNNFDSPNVSLTNTGLTPNPFFSMNNFQPTSFSTPRQASNTSTNSSWLPSTTATAATSSINAHQRADWNPFQ
jgi:hypothetical protein